MDDDDEISAGRLAKLLGVTLKSIADLAKRGIAMRGEKRGTYRAETITRYCEQLREEAAARGGEAAQEARARLGTAQASLAEARAAQLRGENVPVADVEKKWTAACRSIRGRVLAVADKMRDLPARQHVKLVQALRGALSDLADGKT